MLNLLDNGSKEPVDNVPRVLFNDLDYLKMKQLTAEGSFCFRDLALSYDEREGTRVIPRSYQTDGILTSPNVLW